MRALHGFAVNEPKVIHECVDGEVLVVNLADGAYYSLVGSAATAWTTLADGASVDALIDALERRHDATRESIAEGVTAFVDAIVHAGLVRAREPGEWSDRWSGERGAFVAPRLDRYTDIEESMKVDPVHEVDDRGWLTPNTG